MDLSIKAVPINRWIRLLRYVQQRYFADGCKHSAAALTYMTLFALVPLMTVMYAILSAVPAFQEVGMQIQELVFKNFVPDTGQEVQEYLTQFSQKARKLTGVGIAFVGITAIVMLKNIEKTFNRIWHTRDNRSGLSSFLLYWAILSLGPLFIGLALGISGYLVSLQVIFDQADAIGIGPHLLRLVPYLLTSAAFTLIFWAVPNCRVPFKNAAIGGLVTALVFELAKQLFTSIVANTSYQTVYGTFAAIPLFLLWIYVSWLILLAGAELVNALSGFSTRGDELYNDLVIALSVLELLWEQHQRGESIREQHLLRQRWLMGRHSISSERWTPIRDQLFDAGLLRESGYDEYVLGRDLNHFSLWDLYRELGYAPEVPEVDRASAPAWFCACIDSLEDVNRHNREALSQPLSELFSAKKPAEPTT